MSDAQTTFMIEELVKELALRLMEERGLSMKQALDTIYNSETYTKVLDLRTSLFSQSTAYVYSILETEILTGKLGNLRTIPCHWNQRQHVDM
jgi:hypothetical protein